MTLDKSNQKQEFINIKILHKSTHLAIAFNAVSSLRRSQDNVLLLRTYILHIKSHKTPLYIVSMYCT